MAAPWLLSGVSQLRRAAVAREPWRPWTRFMTTKKASMRPCLVTKRGHDLLHDPWFNKGTSFGAAERDRLGLRGLLPPRTMNFQQQIDRFMADFKSLKLRTREGPKDLTSLAKWRILNRLHDRNETLYYKILIDNIQEFAPIIYTPTVGLVCQNYSGLFRRPRGMYFSAEDRREMVSMVYNWPSPEVDIIVVTDGSRILGLGDLGVQGIGIPIGKLDLYVAAAGFNPQRVLPVQIDVGTNNQKLLENPLYLGLRQPRLEGEEYVAVIDEFMEAVYQRWPRVIVQFEDFQNKWAFRMLQRYRTKHRMFNDDVQGTAGIAVAGILGAVRAQGRPMEEIAQQKIVVVGAGSAGLGVVNMVRHSMAIMLGSTPAALTQAASNFWVVDKDGLITAAREFISPDVVEYARLAGEADEEGGLREGARLVDVVKKVRPDILLGLSGVGGLFTKEVLEAMKLGRNSRPAVFPLSNPTVNSECTAEEAFQAIGPNLIFAGGSPFPDVDFGNGQIGHANQGNNMYLFPGIGLGALLSGARIISDGMLQAAATTLAAYMGDDDVKRGIIYPPTSKIREITAEVGGAVVRAAVEEGLAEGYRETKVKELQRMSEEETAEYVARNMWAPDYSPLVYKQPI